MMEMLQSCEANAKFSLTLNFSERGVAALSLIGR